MMRCLCCYAWKETKETKLERLSMSTVAALLGTIRHLDTSWSGHLPRVEAPIRAGPRSPTRILVRVRYPDIAARISYRQSPETPWEHSYTVVSRSSNTSSRKHVYSAPADSTNSRTGLLLYRYTWMRISARSTHWYLRSENRVQS